MSIEKNKSIVEDTLLKIKAVEEAISENAKGILASTMKQEISELVKESLNGSKKTKKSLYEQEEDPTMDDENEEGNDEIDPAVDDVEMDDEEMDDEEMDDEEMDDEEMMTAGDNEMAPLDMTNATPDEVLKVFKAMGDEDGIIVKKEGGYLHLSDDSTNKDYLIQTENYKRNKNMRRSRIDELRFIDSEEEMGGSPEETTYELEIDEPMSDDENLHDIEMGTHGEDMEDMEGTEYELEYEDLEESFKPKGKVGKMKFSYPKSMKKGVTETSDEDEELDEDWDLEEDDDLIHLPTGSMEESFKPKGKVGKMKFSYPKSMKKGVTETSDEDEELDEDWDLEEDDDLVEMRDEDAETSEAARTMTYRRRAERNRVTAPSQVRKESVNKEVNLLREKNEEYKKALDFFRNKLNEVAVFNSNLAYSTRLFTEHSTTKQEKINILRRFDNVETIKESKNLYQSIKRELDGKGNGNVVSESITKKVIKTPQSGSATNLIESKTYENPQFLRIKDLMVKIK